MTGKTIFVLLGFFIVNVNCANILIAYDLIAPSHHIWNYALAKGLVDKGHNVTMIGPFTEREDETAKYHPISIKELIHKHEEAVEKMTELNPFSTLLWMFELAYDLCNVSYHTRGFKRLMGYPKNFKFDAILYDMSAYSCFYPLVEKFKFPPSIGVTPFLLPPYLSDLFGNSLQPAYVSHFLLSHSEHMSFIERTWNYIITTFDVLKRQIYDIHYLEKLAQKVWGRNFDFRKIQRHFSLLLANYSPLLNDVQPLTPNIIPVGGLHARPAGNLQPILKSILDNAGGGFIFFSLGTNLEPSRFPRENIKAILDAFSRLKYITVIWKVNGQFDKDLEIPSNLIIMKWLPQNDIFGHPNIKLFITHGGALSIQEAVYHGIPMLGIPFFMDQIPNVRRIVEKKIGLKVDFSNFTADSFYEAINEILTKPIYSKNAKTLSKLIRDQPETPLQRALFWIEYVIRHNGTEFLSPPSRDMLRITISNADVIIFLISLLVLPVLFITCLLRTLFCRKCKAVQKTEEKIKTH